MFRKYETADISGKNVDHRVDMCNLPFTDGSFDVVIASHVHYIRDEASASHAGFPSVILSFLRRPASSRLVDRCFSGSGSFVTQ